MDSIILWIKEHIGENIDECLLDQCLDFKDYIVKDLQVYKIYEGQEDLVYTAKDTNDLSAYFYHIATYLYSQKMELSIRSEEEQKWHYTRLTTSDGKWTYGENKNFIYDTVYDSRKYWMEYHLKLLMKVYGKYDIFKVALKYEGYLNKWFIEPHWRYNGNGEFIEISDSKLFDFE